MHTASETSSAASQVQTSNDVVDSTKAMAQGGFSMTRLHGNFVLPIILRTRRSRMRCKRPITRNFYARLMHGSASPGVWLRLHRNSVRPMRTPNQGKVVSALWIVHNPGTSRLLLASLVSYLSKYLSHSHTQRSVVRSRIIVTRLSRFLHLPAWCIPRLVAVHFSPGHTSHYRNLLV